MRSSIGHPVPRWISRLGCGITPPPPRDACVVEQLEDRRLLHAGHPQDPHDQPPPAVPLQQTDIRASPLLPDLTPVVHEGLGHLHGWILDSASQPGRDLLRLTVTIANVGTGPMEIRGGSYVDASHRDVLQRVFAAEGGSSDRLAGTFVAHPEHGHIHFEDFAEYRLRAVAPGDGVGSVVRSGGKISFCLLDESQTPFHVEGTVPDARYEECNDTIQGISVGWMDVYERTLPDQWIDVTGVAPGRYWLEVAADPLGRLLEADDSNNEARILIELDPSILAVDRLEPNGSWQTATDLGVLGNGLEPQLSIHVAGDQDFFRFTAASSGTVTVAVSGASGEGKLNLVLLDAGGAQLSASINPRQDQQLTAALTQGQTYFVKVSADADSTYRSYTLSVQDIAPMVTVTAGVAQTGESPSAAPGSFVITRNGPVNATLTVRYAVGGTAINGQDAETLTGSVVIPVRQSSVTVLVRPINDAEPENPKTLTLTLIGNAGYAVDPAAASASLTIADDDTPQPLPAPWSSADIGPAGGAGAAGVLPNGQFRLTSAGGNAAKRKNDVLHLASQMLEGYGAAIARVVDWDRADATAMAGIVLREGTAPGARGVTLAVNAAGNLQLIVRRSTNGRAVVKTVRSAAVDSAGVWLRLLRVGRTITAATSIDGVSWQLSETVRVRLAARISAGVACGGSNDPGHVSTARFAEALVAPAPAAPSPLTATRGSGGILLTWSDQANSETAYVVERARKSRKRFTPIAELAPNTIQYEDLATLSKGRHYYRVRALAPGGDVAGPNVALMFVP